MLFNTPQFALFFLALLVFYYALPGRFRNPVLLAASLIFYTLWIPAYLILLLGDVLVNYALLQAIARGRHAKLYLTLSCVFSLGLLAFFKYAVMILETLAPALAIVSPIEMDLPQIFLPLGISFYSFQILSLSIDTYRGEIKPVKSFSRYLLFISFFPQLIAGPILRGNQFLPQLEHGGQPSFERTRRGFWLIGVGLAKKVVLADFLLAPFVDQVFAVQGPISSPIHLIALYSFAFQIYYDFSGYTDMARGMALLLGFEIPANFLEPYLSRNPSEFWRRWHITLSRWLADYLYIPLGGNRRGSTRTYLNLMLTMVLGGLWHGASWTFVAWGACHGFLLIGHRLLNRPKLDLTTPLGLRDAPKIFLLFNAVCFAWIFFRCEDLEHALRFIDVLLACKNPYGWPLLQTGVVLICIALQIGERGCRQRLPAMREKLIERSWGPALEGTLLGITLGIVLLVGGTGGDFIYFQF